MSELKEGIGETYKVSKKEDNELMDEEEESLSKVEESKGSASKDLKSYEQLREPSKLDYSQFESKEDTRNATLKHYWTKEEVILGIY